MSAIVNAEGLTTVTKWSVTVATANCKISKATVLVSMNASCLKAFKLNISKTGRPSKALNIIAPNPGLSGRLLFSGVFGGDFGFDGGFELSRCGSLLPGGKSSVWASSGECLRFADGSVF